MRYMLSLRSNDLYALYTAIDQKLYISFFIEVASQMSFIMSPFLLSFDTFSHSHSRPLRFPLCFSLMLVAFRD